jgi:hypothetical protein
MVIGGIDAAEGLALPFPALRFDIPLLSPANLSVLALFFFFCFPFLIWLLLALRWKSIADLERKKLIATAALCSLSLLQGSHRVDYPHLLQAVPLVFALGGWAANSLWQASKANKAGNAFYLAPFVVMLAFFSLPVSLIRYSSWPKVDLAGSVGKIRAYALPNKELLASIVQKEMADQSEAEIMQYIDRCTTEHQRLLVLPNLSTYYFYVDRAFGGGQMLVGPGYFSSVSDQNRMVARMARQDIPLIVYYPNFVYDNMPNRKFSAFAPNVLSYMESNYMNILPAGPVELMLRNDLNVDRQGDTLSGFSCPQPELHSRVPGLR